MEDFKNSEELYELKLLYDNFVAEKENTGGMNKDIAQGLYNVYDGMSDILKDNLIEIKEEIFNNPSEMKNYSLGILATIYDISKPEEQNWLLDKVSNCSGGDNSEIRLANNSR